MVSYVIRIHSKGQCLLTSRNRTEQKLQNELDEVYCSQLLRLVGRYPVIQRSKTGLCDLWSCKAQKRLYALPANNRFGSGLS